jgi:2,3-diketo-5-methylthio-1-phosphopentane phosphatase
MKTASEEQSTAVLVSDFDGTMTRHDFYKLAIEQLIASDVPDYWAGYRSGLITHFEALRSYFAQIKATEKQMLDVVHQMELDPQLPVAVESLKSAGWQVVVASAGCEWYIRRLLASADVDVQVYANPGQFDEDRGLLMEISTGSPYFSATLGVDKAGVVRDLLSQGRTVAFAGDGFPDAEASQLVSADLRFARGDLADVLLSSGLSFHFFANWSDIADRLLERGI